MADRLGRLMRELRGFSPKRPHPRATAADPAGQDACNKGNPVRWHSREYDSVRQWSGVETFRIDILPVSGRVASWAVDTAISTLYNRHKRSPAVCGRAWAAQERAPVGTGYHRHRFPFAPPPRSRPVPDASGHPRPCAGVAGQRGSDASGYAVSPAWPWSPPSLACDGPNPELPESAGQRRSHETNPRGTACRAHSPVTHRHPISPPPCSRAPGEGVGDEGRSRAPGNVTYHREHGQMQESERNQPRPCHAPQPSPLQRKPALRTPGTWASGERASDGAWGLQRRAIRVLCTLTASH
jgi:hypothetical protein